MNGTDNVAYFLIDVHCGNSFGIADREPGFFILIKFDSLFQIERYIEEAYQLSVGVYPPCFHIQFISVKINADDVAITKSSQVNYFRRIKRQQTEAKKNLQEKQKNYCKKNSRIGKIYANFKCSSRHKQVKKGDRIQKESRARK